jgi:hypothetical protein
LCTAVGVSLCAGEQHTAHQSICGAAGGKKHPPAQQLKPFPTEQRTIIVDALYKQLLAGWLWLPWLQPASHCPSDTAVFADVYRTVNRLKKALYAFLMLIV